MTSVALYKFINENSVEWKWAEKDSKQDVLIFPSIYVIEDFYKLQSPTVFDEAGIKCYMKGGYFAIWMNDVCEYYGIEMNEVFPK